LTLYPGRLVQGQQYLLLMDEGFVFGVSGAGVEPFRGFDGTEEAVYGFQVDDRVAPRAIGATPTASHPFAARITVRVTFDEAVVGGTGSLTVTHQNTGEVLAFEIRPHLTATAVVVPVEGLEEGAIYEVLLPAGSVQDMFGNPCSMVRWRFEVVEDVVAPEVVRTVPAADGVLTDGGNQVVLTFSETVQAAEGHFQLTAEGDATPIFISTKDTAQVAVRDSMVTITFLAPLDKATKYSMSVTPGAIQDISGNAAVMPVLMFTSGGTTTTVEPQMIMSTRAPDFLAKFVAAQPTAAPVAPGNTIQDYLLLVVVLGGLVLLVLILCMCYACLAPKKPASVKYETSEPTAQDELPELAQVEVQVEGSDKPDKEKKARKSHRAKERAKERKSGKQTAFFDQLEAALIGNAGSPSTRARARASAKAAEAPESPVMVSKPEAAPPAGQDEGPEPEDDDDVQPGEQKEFSWSEYLERHPEEWKNAGVGDAAGSGQAGTAKAPPPVIRTSSEAEMDALDAELNALEATLPLPSPALTEPVVVKPPTDEPPRPKTAPAPSPAGPPAPPATSPATAQPPAAQPTAAPAAVAPPAGGMPGMAEEEAVEERAPIMKRGKVQKKEKAPKPKSSKGRKPKGAGAVQQAEEGDKEELPGLLGSAESASAADPSRTTQPVAAPLPPKPVPASPPPPARDPPAASLAADQFADELEMELADLGQ